MLCLADGQKWGCAVKVQQASERSGHIAFSWYSKLFGGSARQPCFVHNRRPYGDGWRINLLCGGDPDSGRLSRSRPGLGTCGFIEGNSIEHGQRNPLARRNEMKKLQLAQDAVEVYLRKQVLAAGRVSLECPYFCYYYHAR